MSAERRPVGGLHLVGKDRWLPEDLKRRIAAWSPKSELGRIVRACFGYLPPELAGELLDRISSTLVIESSLALVHIDGRTGLRYDIGVVSHKVITDAGVAFLVDAWQNSVELENMKYHALGTGSTAEAASQTALVTELTTQYNPDNTRATGSLTETSAPVFATVGTNTVDASATIAEHAVMSQAATGGGTMWDRSLTGSVALSASDSLQSTYSMTASAGG